MSHHQQSPADRPAQAADQKPHTARRRLGPAACALGTVLLLAPIAQADDESPRGPRREHRMGGPHMMLVHMAQSADADQDGKVSRDEMNAAVAAVDTDGDGFLSHEELQAHRQAVREAKEAKAGERGKRQRRGVDQNGDERLSVEEVQSLFERLDRDGDGFLTEADRPERGRSMRRGPRGGFFLHLADVDGDQKLTQAEWTGFLAAADADSDGTLTREELEALRPEDAPQHGAGPRAGHEPPALEVARLAELFTQLDADADGDIEGDEWPRRGPRGPRNRDRGERAERSPRGERF